ncbi:MAG TPA: tetratricopeptide repeat protein [Pirellulales bacterium]|nr:tetratricopeptide repeat protein [Pirellulales bacterium]
MRRSISFVLFVFTLASTVPEPAAVRGATWEDLWKQFFSQQKAGRFKDAERTAQELVTLAEAKTPAEPLLVARALNAEGVACEAQERYPEAESLFAKALALRERELPAEHADIAQSLDNLALIYDRLGRFSAAETTAKRAVEMGTKVLPADSRQLAHALKNLGLIYDHQGRYAEAEPCVRRALAIYEKSPGSHHVETASCLNVLARLCDHQGRYLEAESLFQRTLELRQKILPANHPDIALALGGLAQLYQHLGRYGEAEPLFKQSLAIYARAPRRQQFEFSLRLNQLGILYERQGRYAEAEPLYKRSLAIARQTLPPEHPDTMTAMHNLAALYEKERRYAEAEPLFLEALALWEKTLPPDHPATATCLSNLGVLYKQQGDFAAAEKFSRRALEAKMRSLGPEHPNTALSLNNLAWLYHKQQKDAEAETLYKQALAIRQRALGPTHPDVAASLQSLASFYHELGRDAEAEEFVDRAILLRDHAQVSPVERFDSYELRAQIAWKLGQRSEAVADLRHALDLAEQQRGLSSGAEQERAEFFGRFSGAFERMVAWQLELGDLGEALSAIERSRARSLLDEMNLGAVDLQIGRPPAERERLRRREMELQGDVAAKERQLSDYQASASQANSDERQKRGEELLAELAATRSRLYDFYRDQRGNSPVYRNLLSVGGEPPRLSQVRRKLVGSDGLLLAYLFGENGGYVLTVGPQSARLSELKVSAELAGPLGVDAGPLTAARLRSICAGENGRGVAAQLASPRLTPQTVAALFALWKLLIPEAERDALSRGKIKKLVVAPDGALAWLPLETLIVDPSEPPRYLLDLSVAVFYAPSATVLYNLAERAAPAGQSESPVLTAADPAYPAAGAPAESGLQELQPRSRYRAAGGALTPLPYSELESQWVAEAFQRQGVPVSELRKQAATEAAVRAGAAKGRLIHLACHGLAEQSLGNFFGALALTPGGDEPANDGFLTLPEIYELNLKSCELAILSACQTNFGPQQQGEGVWALSRGFLVAGARRVTASNWLVDDEAAASLIGMYCRTLARAEGQGQPPDYARALLEAKRWVRQQEKWQNPYFWGTFVLIGPN